MSGLDVPVWKQELLKRKQAKLTHEKLLSGQNASNTKCQVGNAGSIKSNVLIDYRFVDSENKKNNDSVHHIVLGKSSKNIGNSTKGNSYNRNVSLGVDSTNKSQTIQANFKSDFVSVDPGRSRLDSFDENPTRTGMYNEKVVSNNMHGMQQNTRVDVNKEKLNVINNSDKTELKESEIYEGVECEHISPQDVKKMWQQQATKDEGLLKSHHKNLGPAKHTPNPEVSKGVNTKVPSNLVSTPKAYKSPFAKSLWRRPALVIDKKLAKNNIVMQDTENVKPHIINPSSSKYATAICNENEIGKDEVEHIQSVKSLLGFFGGKAKPDLNRKVSDNILFGNKTAKGKDNCSAEFKSFSSKKPGLFKHHSEPNLLFPTDKKSIHFTSSTPQQSPTIEISGDDTALPSHQVSQGIQDRMTRLRRASHSTMEDMDGFSDYEMNRQHQKTNIPTHNGSQTNQKHSPKLTDISNKWSPNRLESCEQATVLKQNIIGNNSLPKNVSRLDENILLSVNTSVGQTNESLYDMKNVSYQSNNIKPSLSHSANTDRQHDSPVSGTPQNVEYQYKNNITNNEINTKLSDQGLSKQGLDLLQPADGPVITNNTACMVNKSEHKSINQYQNNQSNYVVQSSQSDSRVHNNVSTECLTEIKQSKQEEVKTFIKNNEPSKDGVKLGPKPRRKGLNVVDPLAVLELTKDPILLKETPATEEMGVFKDSPSGKVQIIKHEPDKKNHIAQINRAWDLENYKPTFKQNMPASIVNVPPMCQKNVPVTTIDKIPVTSIDGLNMAGQQQIGKRIDDSAFYNHGTLTNGDVGTTSESEGEFIPVSSVDVEADVGPPPEIVFDTMPGNYKSSFSGQKGKVWAYILIFGVLFVTQGYAIAPIMFIKLR